MTRLDRILAAKRDEVAALRASGPGDPSDAPSVLPFADTLLAAARQGRCGMIAEFKRTSPSEGDLATDAAPQTIARAYRDSGADCISVLTDRFAFGGDLADIAAAKEASGLPTLRKDFMIDPIQIAEARRSGADAILLILAILDDALAAEMCAQATELGMDVLVETHNEQEVHRALALPSPLIGINNRNLADLSVDLAVTERLAPMIPANRLVIAESGITASLDIARLRTAGAKAFLIGSHLMRAPDAAAALAPLVAAAGTGKKDEHI